MRALGWIGAVLLAGAVAVLSAYVHAGDAGARLLQLRRPRGRETLREREKRHLRGITAADVERNVLAGAPLRFPIGRTIRCEECGVTVGSSELLGHLLAGHSGRPPFDPGAPRG